MNSQEIADTLAEAARETTKTIQDTALRWRGLPIIRSTDFTFRTVTLGIAPHAMDFDSGMEAEWQEVNRGSK